MAADALGEMVHARGIFFVVGQEVPHRACSDAACIAAHLQLR